MDQKQNRLLKTTFILFVGMLGTKLINFIMLPFYTNWLSVEEYGTIDIFLVIISMIVPILTLQLEQGIFRFLIDDKTIDEKKITISSGINVMFFILLIVDVPALIYIFNFMQKKYLLYLLAINLQCIYVMIQQIARGVGKNKEYSVNSIILAFFNLIFCIYFIRYKGLESIGYILAFCIAHFVATIVMVFQIKASNLISFISFSMKKAKELLKYSIPLIINNISWWILNASDKLILNIFCNINANGIYAAAGKIPNLITTGYSVFHMAWQESASREKDGNIEGFYSDIFRKLFVFLSFLTIILLALGRPLFNILIDSKFYEAYNNLPILILGMFFLCISQFYGGIYIGMHKSNSLAITSMLAAITNLVIDLLLVKKIGIYAASISTLISYFLVFFIRYRSLKKLVRIEYKTKENSIISIIIVISFAISYLKNIIISICFAIIISILFLIVYKELVFEFLKNLKKIVIIIP